MDKKKEYLLRIQNCIWTIIDVHNTISEEYDSEEVLSQFEELDENILDLDLAHVSETDVMLVEQATNALLGEFRSIFESGEFGNVYELRVN